MQDNEEDDDGQDGQNRCRQDRAPVHAGVADEVLDGNLDRVLLLVRQIQMDIEEKKTNLKPKKSELKSVEKEVAKLEAKKAKADQKAAEEAKKAEAEAVLKKLLASDMTSDDILEKLK